MRYLFEAFEELIPQFRNHFIALFLDYDGTLTPIVERPELAKITAGQKKLLNHMNRTQGIKPILVSGRALEDLKKLVAVPGLIYVGNHGLELEGPDIHFSHPDAGKFRELMERLHSTLVKSLVGVKGIQIENKGLTLSVHYRRVASDKIAYASDLLQRQIQNHPDASEIVLREGKKVWELRPRVEWDKGKIVLWLLGRLIFQTKSAVFPVYMGDDQTDEDAFKAIAKNGIGILISETTPEQSAAGYFLRSPGESYRFFERLMELKSGRHSLV